MRETVLLLAALLLPAAAGAQDWRGPAAIEVQVEDAKGRNLAGAEVLLVYLSPDGGGSLPSVLTDAAGKASIGGLAAGRWSAEIRHAGHMSYRAELAISADGKPVLQSASHLMAPGAVSTMKVKFSRGRGGAAAPAAPVQAPAAAAPVPAVAKEKTPVREVPPVAPVAPRPAPVPAPAAAMPPVKESPPLPNAAPAPAPVPAAATESAPVNAVPPVPAAAPAPAPVPTAATEKAPVKAVPPAPAAAPAPAVVQAPAAPAQPSSVIPAPLPAATPPLAPAPRVVAPAPAPAAPAPVAAPVAAPPSTPAPAAAVSPARARLCVECPPGESAAWGESAIAGGAAAGCPADLAEKLKSVELDAVAKLSADMDMAGAGCRVIAVELPAGARFTGYRYEAQSAGVAADCLPGRGCPAGDCRFPADPVLRQEGNRTVLLVLFESTAADLRRAVVAGYSTYNKR